MCLPVSPQPSSSQFPSRNRASAIPVFSAFQADWCHRRSIVHSHANQWDRTAVQIAKAIACSSAWSCSHYLSICFDTTFAFRKHFAKEMTP